MSDGAALELARRAHEICEELGPHYGFEPGTDNEIPEWDDLPAHNRVLMVAVAGQLLAKGEIAEAEQEEPTGLRMWRIRRDGDPWWASPYWVIDPDGKPNNGHWWLWTAKRALRRARRTANPSVVWVEPDRP